MRARWMFLTVPILFFVSCDTPTETTGSSDPTFKKPIPTPMKQSCYDPDDPLCLPGPSPDDPDPDAPGYFIGPDYNMDHCTQSNDFDYDGFDDNCEYRIARRFAPLLATVVAPYDDTSAEPYWVAEYEENLPGGPFSGGLKVMYLLSYHEDLGTRVEGQTLYAHKGDSEFVVLWIGFREATQHWELTWAYYAAHHGEPGESDFVGAARLLEFPDQYYGYPRIWVAKSKHASYISRDACNAGGLLGFDACETNQDDRRVEVLQERNLGSGEHRFLNCVTTTESSPYTYPGTECFWHDPINTTYEFCGWGYADYDRDLGCATRYAVHLATFGFTEGI